MGLLKFRGAALRYRMFVNLLVLDWGASSLMLWPLLNIDEAHIDGRSWLDLDFVFRVFFFAGGCGFGSGEFFGCACGAS